MKAHAVVAAMVVLVILVLYGVADKTDRGVKLDYPKLRGAAILKESKALRFYLLNRYQHGRLGRSDSGFTFSRHMDKTDT